MIGVKYTSAWCNPSGYGSAAREFITALFFAGVNLTLETVSQMSETADFGVSGDICKRLVNRDIDYKFHIIHLTPDLYPLYREKGKINIGHIFWETTHLPKEWIDPMNKMDELWTASPQMEEMIRSNGIKTVIRHFPQPIDITHAYSHIPPFKSQEAKDFVFYSIFHWILRKNPKLLLNAYWKEFEGEKNVTLLLKVYRITYLEQEIALIRKDIENWKKELKQKHFPKIHLVTKLLSDSGMYRLHQMGDVFVSPSSGEGWLRPQEEAMLLGKPTVSGGVGGLTDLIPEELYFKVTSNLTPAKKTEWIPWYSPNMNWRELSEESLREKLRFLFDHFDKGQQVGKKGQEYVTQNFSYQTVGNQMKKRLEEI